MEDRLVHFRTQAGRCPLRGDGPVQRRNERCPHGICGFTSAMRRKGIPQRERPARIGYLGTHLRWLVQNQANPSCSGPEGKRPNPLVPSAYNERGNPDFHRSRVRLTFMVLRLADITPDVSPDELVAQLVPPSMFDEVSFDSYIPDPGEPSQAEARDACRAFAEEVVKAKSGKKKGLFGKKRPVEGRGIYLDGGFGVGKTHLLASIFHACPAPKSFGTFVELTNVVGALGFNRAVEELSTRSVLCIDEFELDDPGDTMLVSRLLAELSAAGVFIAATSNTLPGQLGEGRFAAADFLREIRKISGLFQTLRVDGPDFRHRDLPPAPDPMSNADLEATAAEVEGSTLDDFDELCRHLDKLHPSKYNRLVGGITQVCLENVHPVENQAIALRVVVLADRLYDAGIPVRNSGAKLDEIFTPEMINGGYKKKYLRATSRLLALSRFQPGDTH